MRPAVKRGRCCSAVRPASASADSSTNPSSASVASREPMRSCGAGRCPPAPTSRTVPSSGPSGRRSTAARTTNSMPSSGRPPATWPGILPAVATRLEFVGTVASRRSLGGTRATPGADARGRARHARPAGGASTGRPGPRGRPSRRCRDAGARDIPGRDRDRPAARPDRRRTSPTSCRATTRGSSAVASIAAAPRPLERLSAAAARPWRAGGPDRGDRGRACIGQPAAAGRRAVGWQPARRRGASRRPPRAADRVADRLARRAGDRPARDPVAGVPARPASPRPGRSPARPRAAGGGRRRVRGRDTIALLRAR